jgi:hypothetical protein
MWIHQQYGPARLRLHRKVRQSLDECRFSATRLGHQKGASAQRVGEAGLWEGSCHKHACIGL